MSVPDYHKRRILRAFSLSDVQKQRVLRAFRCCHYQKQRVLRHFRRWRSNMASRFRVRKAPWTKISPNVDSKVSKTTNLIVRFGFAKMAEKVLNHTPPPKTLPQSMHVLSKLCSLFSHLTSTAYQATFAQMFRSNLTR